MERIYLDIETLPTQCPAVIERISKNITPPKNITKASSIEEWYATKKSAAVDAAVRATSFNGGLGHIACISFQINDGAIISNYSHQWHKDEREILHHVFSQLDVAVGSNPYLYIGHYVAEFDLRFLYHRAVVLGVAPPKCFPINPRPWDAEIFDLMEKWAGRNNRISLEELCAILGIRGKGDMDGSKVYDYVMSGRIAEVSAYCDDDVYRTYEAHKRMTFMEASA